MSSRTPAQVRKIKIIINSIKIFRNFIDLLGSPQPLKSTNFNQILNIAPPGHVQTIHNIIKDSSHSQEHQNHHQLQQDFQKYLRSFKIIGFLPNFKHQSSLTPAMPFLKGILMPSNSTYFNQIPYIVSSEHI
jgi:hypothetical protein